MELGSRDSGLSALQSRLKKKGLGFHGLLLPDLQP